MPCREESNRNTKTFHFTLGPVQGFVAQARRTRDLWAGSFLLAYLTGQAMSAVINAGGKIVFPLVHDEQESYEIKDPLLKAILERQKNKTITDPPMVGTLPNCFKAQVPEDFDINNCRQAIFEAWELMAKAVWDKFIYKAAKKGNGTEDIWRRQINFFWDMAWVVESTENIDGNLLERRKNWRTHRLLPEPGDKCTIAGNLQEISGCVRARQKEKQDAFWQKLSTEVVRPDLRDDERLAAVTIVKRLFPQVAREAIGWEVSLNYPSTLYMSAIHWMEKTARNHADLAVEYMQAIEKRLKRGRCKEANVQIECLRKVLEEQKEQKGQKDQSVPNIAKFFNLDANFFYKDALLNDRLWNENTEKEREKLAKILEKLEKTAGSPSRFYALLLMDGDRLGALLESFDAKVISQALARFTSQVQGIVTDNNGTLIYAGGDDVLALLPLEDALVAAVALRQAYKRAFADCTLPDGEAIPPDKVTISAGLVYAHNTAPLKAILAEAHKQLDKVAKEETGRDSVAIAVWKTSGSVLKWSAPWESAPWEKIVAAGESTNLLNELVRAFKGSTTEEKQYNSSFFYNIRKNLDLLIPSDGGEFAINFVELVMAEYLKNTERKEKSGLAKEEVRKRIERLEKVCRQYHRVPSGSGYVIETKDSLNINGALLIRFLAEESVSSGGES